MHEDDEKDVNDSQIGNNCLLVFVVITVILFLMVYNFFKNFHWAYG